MSRSMGVCGSDNSPPPLPADTMMKRRVTISLAAMSMVYQQRCGNKRPRLTAQLNITSPRKAQGVREGVSAACSAGSSRCGVAATSFSGGDRKCDRAARSSAACSREGVQWLRCAVPQQVQSAVATLIRGYLLCQPPKTGRSKNESCSPKKEPRSFGLAGDGGASSSAPLLSRERSSAPPGAIAAVRPHGRAASVPLSRLAGGASNRLEAAATAAPAAAATCNSAGVAADRSDGGPLAAAAAGTVPPRVGVSNDSSCRPAGVCTAAGPPPLGCAPARAANMSGGLAKPG